MKKDTYISYTLFISILIGMVFLWGFTHRRPLSIRIDPFHSIQVEIADTPSMLAKGLMFRTSLPKDHGMLFKFPEEKPWAFWMKNTFIPLDIIWLNKHKQVIYFIDDVQPCFKSNDCIRYAPHPEQNAKYVLELAAGERARLYIQLKQKLHFKSK